METTTIYIPLTALAEVLGLPRAYLKHLTDQGKLPYLEPRKRFYCLADVLGALSKLAHANMVQPVPETPLDYGEFNARITKVLRLRNITTWEKLAATPETELLSAPNFGPGSLREVQAKLAARQAQGELWPPPAETGTNTGEQEPEPHSGNEA